MALSFKKSYVLDVVRVPNGAGANATAEAKRRASIATIDFISTNALPATQRKNKILAVLVSPCVDV
jgi:hypothetical protein